MAMGTVAGRKKKTVKGKEERKNNGLKTFYTSFYLGKYIGFSYFSNAKAVWHT